MNIKYILNFLPIWLLLGFLISTEDIKLVYAVAIIFTSVLAIYAYWHLKKQGGK